MKRSLPYIKAGFLLVLVVFLFGFAEKRHSARKINDVKVHFTDSENLYVPEEVVNKLLIQNDGATSGEGLEALDLNRVESLLNAHDMIENAEVYLTLDGQLAATVSQRKPIGRAIGNSSFYLDRQGKVMPLSAYYSARVPLLTGFNEKNVSEVYPLLNQVEKDDFLKKHITGIHRLPGGKMEVHVRGCDFDVYFGDSSRTVLKFNNFKAFYKKAQKDEKLNTYKKVNLQFGDQVVCTKK